MKLQCHQTCLGLARITLGWIFLWAFLDKLFGLGFSTAAQKAWIRGGSPTLGFLTNSPKGPFENIFHAMAGSTFVDWLFMVGLLCLGISLILGIGMKIAGYAGTALMLLMWLAVLPPKTNPVVDEHIVYALLLLSFTHIPAGEWLGFGRQWARTRFVQQHPWLR